MSPVRGAVGPRRSTYVQRRGQAAAVHTARRVKNEVARAVLEKELALPVADLRKVALEKRLVAEGPGRPRYNGSTAARPTRGECGRETDEFERVAGGAHQLVASWLLRVCPNQ